MNLDPAFASAVLAGAPLPAGSAMLASMVAAVTVLLLALLGIAVTVAAGRLRR